MSRGVAFGLGWLAAFALVCALYVIRPHAMVPPGFQCFVRSADGCVAYVDPIRAKRYLDAEAGR